MVESSKSEPLNFAAILNADDVCVALLNANAQVLRTEGGLAKEQAFSEKFEQLLVGLEGVTGSISNGDLPSFHLDEITLEAKSPPDQSPRSQPLVVSLQLYPNPPNGVLAFMQDRSAVAEITRENVQARNELALARAEREAALGLANAANEAKTQFLRTVTHELRSPLSLLIGNAEFLENEVTDGDASEAVGDILEQSRDLMSLVDSLLDLAKIEAGKVELLEEKIDLVAMVGHVASQFQRQAEQFGIDLSTAPPQERLWLKADRMRVTQSLTNLISNALKFTPKGGSVAINTLEDTFGVHCIVLDTGPGMSTSQLAKVGESFLRSGAAPQHAGQKSSGLGLALVDGLMKLHGGQLVVENRVEAGEILGLSAQLRFPRDRLLLDDSNGS